MTTKSRAIKKIEKITGTKFNFPNLIKSERLCRDMTQEQFGELLGVRKSYVCDLEKGRATISISKVLEIAKKLDSIPDTFVQLAMQWQLEQAGVSGLTVEVKRA